MTVVFLNKWSKKEYEPGNTGKPNPQTSIG